MPTSYPRRLCSRRGKHRHPNENVLLTALLLLSNFELTSRLGGEEWGDLMEGWATAATVDSQSRRRQPSQKETAEMSEMSSLFKYSVGGGLRAGERRR
ncbi:hypothetical protein BDZ89DRAFT_146944 [Hymenopellis radicata]|nr:hypothetical protein BDZ89DRAFT_146944 [Hymenopellis radicata]